MDKIFFLPFRKKGKKCHRSYGQISYIRESGIAFQSFIRKE